MTRATLATLFVPLACACPDNEPPTPQEETGQPITGDDDDPDDTGGPVPTPPLSGVSVRLDEEHPSIAIVSWEQDRQASVHIEFSFEGEQRSSPERTLAAGPHEELLLGVPYGTDVGFEIVAQSDLGERRVAGSVRTAEIPGGMPLGLVERSEPSLQEPEMDYLLVTVDEIEVYGLGGVWWAMILDRAGRVVWGYQSPIDLMIMHPRIGVNGDVLLIDHNSHWGDFDGGIDSEILEMKIDGTLIWRWETPGLHHPFTQLPDESIVYGAYFAGVEGYEEIIYKVDRTGSYVGLFDCRDWLAEIGEFGVGCGSNTITYHEPTDTLLTSWFTFDTIVELDASTGEPTRWFGHVDGSYGFDPQDSAFWYQHGGYITESGTLLTSTHLTEDNFELLVREYEIDDAEQVLRQVWSVGEGEGLVGNQMGEAHRLPGGNTLHNFGTNAHLREYTPEGDVVWEMGWAPEHTIGRSAPILFDLYDLAPERM